MVDEKRILWLRAKIDGAEHKAETIVANEDFAWDSEEIVTLSRSDIHSILLRFLNREMSAANVEIWADFLEARDDVGFEAGHAELIKHVLYTLATPELEGQLTNDSAQHLLGLLGE